MEFFESYEFSLMHMIATLIMSTKLATPGLLIINVCWNKGYDVIASVHGIIIFLHNLNYIADVDIAEPKFGQSEIWPDPSHAACFYPEQD